MKKVIGRNETIIIVNTLDELIDLFNEEEQSPDSTIVLKDGKTKKKKTWQILDELRVTGLQMIDRRTEMILEEYLFYQKAPHQAPYDSKIWKKSVIMLNNAIQTGLF